MSDKKYRPENHTITIETGNPPKSIPSTDPTIISFYETEDGKYPNATFDMPITIQQLGVGEQVLRVMKNVPELRSQFKKQLIIVVFIKLIAIVAIALRQSGAY